MRVCTAGVRLPALKEVKKVKKVGARESLGAGGVKLVAEGSQTVAKSASRMAFRQHLPTTRQRRRTGQTR